MTLQEILSDPRLNGIQKNISIVPISHITPLSTSKVNLRVRFSAYLAVANS